MGKLITVRLPDHTTDKLEQLSHEIRRNKTYIIKSAIDRYLDEYEDYQIALDRLHDKNDRIVTSKELRKSIGL